MTPSQPTLRGEQQLAHALEMMTRTADDLEDRSAHEHERRGAPAVVIPASR
jgi:hypothetical protein